MRSPFEPSAPCSLPSNIARKPPNTTPCSRRPARPAEEAEYRDLKQSYGSLAENIDWLAANSSKTVGSGKPPRAVQDADRHEAYAEQENILRCLGAAVILEVEHHPQKLQRALFEAASSIEDSERKAPLKDVLAQFLHDHKDDAQKQQQHQNGG